MMKQENSEKIELSSQLLEELKEKRGGSLIEMHYKIANDPLLLKAFLQQYDTCSKQGCEIPQKYRELIVMAIGAARGLDTTVKVHSRLAVEHGATVDEIGEVFRLIFMLTGVSGLFQIDHIFDALDGK